MRAVLLVNMGGPANLSEVRPYLRAIFQDPAILPVSTPLRPILSAFIASLRARRVEERYRIIGGASPLISLTQTQRDAVAEAFRVRGDAALVAHAFRYSEPTIPSALTTLKARGVKSILLVPLFPHYTRAMTGSIEAEAVQVAKSLDLILGVCPAWGNHDSILRLWGEYLTDSLAIVGQEARVLFVAHGIPIRDVRNGDDYPERVLDTTRALARSLSVDTEWTLAFQSKVGPVRWTRPYLEETLGRLCAVRKPLVIMPISFAADCLETLYDLDLQAVPRAKKALGDQVVRVPVFNNDPRFAQILAQLAVET